MKGFLFVLFLMTGISGFVYAGDGYRLQLKFSDVTMTGHKIYLAHYYAKPLPTVYKSDSTVFNDKNVAVFQSMEPVTGGIYIFMLDDNKTYFEFLLNNGDNYRIEAVMGTLPLGVTFKSSPENERFQQYAAYLKRYSEAQMKFQADLSRARTHADTIAIVEKSNVETESLRQYRKDYSHEYPHTLLANIFDALATPKVPTGVHYLSDGKTPDSLYAYHYYKAHYWDGFDFKDDRLINTPVYDGKLESYFKDLVEPYADSVEKEGNWLIAQTNKPGELYKYTLHWITNYALNSKVMGMDEAFVYFVENYHMKGDAYWLDQDMLNKYIDKARKIAPNVIGNQAPDITMQDIQGKEHSLYDVKSKYTLLVFWSPGCGVCQQEIPKIDSAYKASLKKRGVAVYAVRTENEDNGQWEYFLKQHNIQDWINVYDPQHKSKYQSQYDVYGTPVIYLLDEKKTIIGKKLDHANIGQVIDMVESKQKNNIKKS